MLQNHWHYQRLIFCLSVDHIYIMSTHGSHVNQHAWYLFIIPPDSPENSLNVATWSLTYTVVTGNRSIHRLLSLVVITVTTGFSAFHSRQWSAYFLGVFAGLLVNTKMFYNSGPIRVTWGTLMVVGCEDEITPLGFTHCCISPSDGI